MKEIFGFATREQMSGFVAVGSGPEALALPRIPPGLFVPAWQSIDVSSVADSQHNNNVSSLV